jgi:hypothetical protein
MSNAQAKAAKEFAVREFGAYGNGGGHVYTNAGMYLGHGWDAVYSKWTGLINNDLTKHCTDFPSFADMVHAAVTTDYVPTLRTVSSKRGAWRYIALADAFDTEMKARGLSKRAERAMFNYA